MEKEKPIRCIMCNAIATDIAEEHGEPLCRKCYLNNIEARYSK
jgi:hypothetical protein